jgi:hypothetical protein
MSALLKKIGKKKRKDKGRSCVLQPDNSHLVGRQIPKEISNVKVSNSAANARAEF